MTLSLLDEELIPVEGGEGRRHTTLPGAFAAFVNGNATHFGDVRPHQRHALHMFAVQVAVMGLESSGLTELPRDADGWRSVLLSIADADAWSLICEDQSKSAFLQPAMGEKDFATARARVDNQSQTPDDVTVLVRSKNHVTKFSRMTSPTPWHWALALLELQTLSGFEGAGLYGIARMNGGFGTRFMIGVYDDLKPAAMWKRDVKRVLSKLPSISGSISAFEEAGDRIGAVWTLPWDGISQLSLTKVHSLFVDVSRRIRLFRSDKGSIVSTYLPTKCARVDAKAQNGLLGDPWAVIKVADAAALGAKTIDLKLLRELIIGDTGVFARSPLQSLEKGDSGDVYFHLAAIVGGQGKTEGYHEVVIPIPGRVRDPLFSAEGAKEIGATANGMLRDADNVRDCLRKAVFVAIQNGAEDIRWKDHDPSDAAAKEATDAFKASYEDTFFEKLWTLHESPNNGEWVQALRESALRILEVILRHHTSRTQLEFKARSAAERTFHGLWKKHFNPMEKA